MTQCDLTILFSGTYWWNRHHLVRDTRTHVKPSDLLLRKDHSPILGQYHFVGMFSHLDLYHIMFHSKIFSSSNRLNMFPDGGIARLRAYGVAVASLPESPHSLVDLSAATNGGVVFHQDDKDDEG